jgi:hypothetical protein
VLAVAFSAAASRGVTGSGEVDVLPGFLFLISHRSWCGGGLSTRRCNLRWKKRRDEEKESQEKNEKRGS